MFRKKIELEMMTQMITTQIEMDQEEQEDQKAIQDKAIQAILQMRENQTAGAKSHRLWHTMTTANQA